MQRFKKAQSTAAFTILELSVVLTVIALIAGTALAIGATRIQATKIENTNEKMAALLEVIDSFVQNYGYLPCPANPQALTTDNDFGVGSSDGAGNCTASNLLSSGNLKLGVIPVSTLGLAPSVMLDGWNRRITFGIDDRFSTATGYSATDPDSGGIFITVRSSNSPSVVVTDKAVLVLVSHGQNGHGAWKAKGGATPIDKSSSDNDEKDNSNLSGDGGINADFVQKFPSETFDDIVNYRLKWQFPAVSP